MREVLGLSLTATGVVWTLVDLKDGTIIADDVVEVDSAKDGATEAARSLETFARQTERHIDAVRLVSSESTAGSALELTSKLRSLGFDHIDVISEDAARYSRNRTARYIDPPLELAYGAARTVTADDHVRPSRRAAGWMPVPTRLPMPPVAPRVRTMALASSVVVVAVGAAVAAYLLVGGARSQPADRAATPVASATPPDDAPVVSVPAAAPPLPPPAQEAVVAPPLPPPAPEAVVAPPLPRPPIEMNI